MGSAQPSASVGIVTCTYGGADVTFLARQKISVNLNAQSGALSTFTPNNDFFGFDPNYGVQKVCVVVYRVLWKASDGTTVQAVGPFRSVAATEGSKITLNWVETVAKGTVFTEPTPDATNQYLVSAYWFTKNITSTAGPLFGSFARVNQRDHDSGQPNYPPISYQVSTTTCGPDPAVGTNKQFSVTYGSWYSGRWVYQAAVDLQQPTIWNLTIRRCLFAKVGFNIIYATYGGADVTSIVQGLQTQFVFNWIQNGKPQHSWQSMPSPSEYQWNIPASNDSMGGDPNPGSTKELVIIYNLAELDSVFTMDDHGNYLSNGSYLTTGSIVSGYRSVDFTEGETHTMDLSKVDWSPDPYFAPPALHSPLKGWPFFFTAQYANGDITNALNNTMFQYAASTTPPGSVAVNLDISKYAPWPGVNTATSMQRNVNALIGWPKQDGSNAYDLYTYVTMLPGNSTNWTMPQIAPLGSFPQVNSLSFKNSAPVTCWPKITGYDTQFSWDPRDSSNWVMYVNQSKTVNLLSDAGCTQGTKYNVTFNIMSVTDPNPTIVTAWGSNQLALELTTQNATKLEGGTMIDYGQMSRYNNESQQ